MILTFPNLDTLRLALTSGAVPLAVSMAPARAAIDPAGLMHVEPSVALKDASLAELRRLGVRISKTTGVPLDLAVLCLPQLLPLERQRDSQPGENTPILFEIADGTRLPELVSEMLRLGNDRQSFRWIAGQPPHPQPLSPGGARGETRAQPLSPGGAKGETRPEPLSPGGARGQTRALVRVIGPPYYSLLRALDDPEQAGGTFAYKECAARVWVQLGWTHPLAEQIQAPAGQVLLMRRPRDWAIFEEGRFRDIYEILDFTLPAQPDAWQVAEPAGRIVVPVRLAPSSSADLAELWVVREDGPGQIDSLVKNADDHLLARLAFAAVEKDGRQLIVLRVRPSKQPAPVLVLNAVGFRPYLRLANLLLPCGKRLHPPLRRDAVAKLLAADVKHVTWLHPNADGTFTPESLPEDAFRPLAQWVDYVLDREHEALTAWVQAHRFEFESFVCADDKPAPKQPGPKQPRPKPTDAGGDAPNAPVATEAGAGAAPRRKKQEVKPADAAVPVEPSQFEKELSELEARFVDLKTPLDSPERAPMWTRLAQLNGALGHPDDAAICCGHALWEADASPGAWLSECRERDPIKSVRGKPTHWPTLLAEESLKPAEVRYLALTVIDLAGHAKPDAALIAQLGLMQQQLQKHETLLGVRLAWLAWEAVHRLTHGDVLTLARARDRLLERLYTNGLSADLDLPGFLRVSGAIAGERYRRIRDHLERLRPMAQTWLDRGTFLAPGTGLYADLMFAYAFARLGESGLSHKLAQEAQERMTQRDDVHVWLIHAFEFRILEALEGKHGGERLPAEMLKTLEITDRLARYKIDRMREHSRILEPHEKIDPYRRWHGAYADDLSRELALLMDVNDRAKLTDRLQRLLAPKNKNRPVEPRVLATALELAPRLGESFADDLLFQVERALANVAEPVDQAMLIEKALILAAHYDKKDEVQSFVTRFQNLLGGKGSELPVLNLESLLGGSFRSLRKLGLREQAARLLERMAEVIKQRETKAAKESERAKVLRLLLQVASGWLYFGDEEPARAVLDSARMALFEATLPNVEQTALACAYAAALGQARLDLALPRTLELYRRLSAVHDTFTTNSHYSLSRLDVVEATILALVNDDFKISPEARRWLDDDEFLVRRRIHRTVHAAMGKAGL